MSDYFETTEAEDVLGSLEHLAFCINRSRLTDHAWKWMVLSLFSAVQGSLVCHAAGSTKIEVLKDHNAQMTLAWLNSRNEGRGHMPEANLASPLTLYNRLSGKNSSFPPAGGLIVTTPEQDKAFQRINSLRDDLVHFVPKRWAIEKAFISCTIPPMLDLIYSILKKGYAFRHGDQAGIERALREIRQLL